LAPAISVANLLLATVRRLIAFEEICDRLGAAEVEGFLARWLHRLPSPFTAADQKAGYSCELAFRQFEVSETCGFDRPQGGGPVAFVVVSHRPAAPLLHRQPWLGAIQGLDLTLFVDAQHDGLSRRIQNRPTTSVNFSRKCGSRERLNVFARWGFRL